MQIAKCYPLTFSRNSTELFERLRPLGNAVFLDSGGSERGRYDILSAGPLELISGDRVTDSELRQLYARVPSTEPNPTLPFSGGLIGWLGYEWGAARHGVAAGEPRANELPQCHVGYFDWGVVTDHQAQTTTLVCQPSVTDQRLNAIRDALERNPDTQKTFALSESVLSEMDDNAYHARFQAIADYLQSGDCYQVNLGRRFSAAYTGDPWQAYKQVRRAATAPWSAYMECASGELMSFSPERLLQLNGRTATTEPIKGTAARHADSAKDEALGKALAASKKNQAENLMIVDLLRNDLGQVAVPGSVKVNKLFELQSFSTVHHLVSNISAELEDRYDALDVLLACFPGGSITGAPKHRAMQIIAELEPVNRTVYCGSLFYISTCGHMDSNIMIRTMSCVDGQLLAWSGGGIVADSTAAKESTETYIKIQPLLDALR